MTHPSGAEQQSTCQEKSLQGEWLKAECGIKGDFVKEVVCSLDLMDGEDEDGDKQKGKWKDLHENSHQRWKVQGKVQRLRVTQMTCLYLVLPPDKAA